MKSIDGLYRKWRSLQPLTEEDRVRLDRKLNLEFNYNSNHLEGNTLTYGQTELLLIFGETSGGAKLRDYEEMQAHNVALKMVREEAADTSKPLTEKFIRDLNELILVKPFYKDAVASDGSPSRVKINVGGYKSRPNHVRTPTDEIFYYATPEETPAMMAALVGWFNEQETYGELHPLELASLLHYRFIRIHPFEDGNGRIARLLTNYVLLRHDWPMIIVKSERKEEYLQVLRRADIDVGLTPSDGANAELSRIAVFADYMEELMEYSLALCIRAAGGESLDEPGDLDKKLTLLKRKLKAPQEDVQLKFSDKAIKQVVDGVINHLMEHWENLLKKFDTIILGRKSFMKNSQGERLLDDFNMVSFMLSVEPPQKIAAETGSVFAIGVIVDINKKFFHRESVDFTFYGNIYEIRNSANEKILTKMYHQTLTDGEIDEIVEALGNKLLEKIETLRNE